jgi:hypothetical protein
MCSVQQPRPLVFKPRRSHRATATYLRFVSPAVCRATKTRQQQRNAPNNTRNKQRTRRADCASGAGRRAQATASRRAAAARPRDFQSKQAATQDAWRNSADTAPARCPQSHSSPRELNTSPRARPRKKKSATSAPLTARRVPAAKCRPRRAGGRLQSAHEIFRADQPPGEMHGATAPTHNPPAARGNTLTRETPVRARPKHKA